MSACNAYELGHWDSNAEPPIQLGARCVINDIVSAEHDSAALLAPQLYCCNTFGWGLAPFRVATRRHVPLQLLACKVAVACEAAEEGMKAGSVGRATNFPHFFQRCPCPIRAAS